MSNKKWEEQIFAHENEYEFAIRWIISWLGEHKAQGKKDIIKLITSLIDQKLTEQREEMVKEVVFRVANYKWHKSDSDKYETEIIKIHNEQLEDIINLIKNI